MLRTFENITDRWLKLYPSPGYEREARAVGLSLLTVTPSHRFLAVDGSFRRIDDILNDDSLIVLADGRVISISAEIVVYSVDTAHLYEQAKVVEYTSVGGVALKPQVGNGWKTYNFEVEDLHTYVAGGVRVHNDSVATLAAAADDFADIFGRPFDGSEHDVGLMMGAIVDGEIIAYGNYVGALSDDRYAGTFYDAIHDKIVLSADVLGYSAATVANDRVTRIVEYESNGGGSVSRDFDASNQHAWASRITGYDAGSGGQPGFSVEIADNGSVSAAQVNGVPIDLGAIGGALGSRLGNMLGHNTFTKIAAGTVLGAIGREVGQLVQFGHSVSLEAAVNGGFTQVLPTFGAGLASGAVGSLTSLLIAELGEALHLDGFTTGLVSTVGTTITQRLAANAFDIAVNGAAVETLFNGFSSTGFFTNMAGAVGGYLGSYLAGVVAMPTSPEGAIGQQIGSSIGGLLGSVFGPLGSFVGSFAGGIAGGALGALFGNDPESGGRIVLRADGQLDIIEKWEDHGGSYQWIDTIAHYQIITTYNLVNLTGGRIDAGYSSAGLRLNQDDRSFWLTRPENTAVAGVSNADSPDDLAPLVDPGVMELVSKIDLVGGDVLTRRAFENSHAANASALAAELMVAKDYRIYLDNAAVINALMAAQPESSFTAGWVLTLLKARELNLDAPSAKDFQHGIAAQLGDPGLMARLDFAPSFDPGAPDTLVLRHASGAEWRRDNAFGPGAAAEFAGTADDNQIHLSGLAVHSIVHAGGGAGQDWLIGSNGTDLIDGGAGNDVIDGGSGHDWLFGGEGNDMLYGSTGDDVVMGGRGDDMIYAGGGFDTLAGGEGNDTVVVDVAVPGARATILAPTNGQSQQLDFVWIFTHPFHLVQFRRVGTDLEMAGAQGGPVIATVKDFFLSKGSIDWFQFAGGTWKTGAEIWTLAGVTSVVEEYAAREDGGVRHFWLDGNESQPWYSVVTDTNVWGQTVATTWYYDNGTVDIGYGDADNVIRGDGSLTFFHGHAGHDQFLGSDGEDWFFGDDGHDTFFGGAGTDRFDAGPGNDLLDGGPGADIMSGASGDDSYVVDNPGDVVNEAGGGNDTVRSWLSYSLGNDVENLVLLGGAVDGVGNGLANAITGNAGTNGIDGLGGADVMIGGAGDDTYYVDRGDDQVVEQPDEGIDSVRSTASFRLGTNVENLLLLAGATVGTGNALNNTIVGNAAANSIDGAAGADGMEGGAGDDTYHIDNPGDSIIEHAHHGNDTARVSVSYRLAEVDIENLVLVTGAGAINGSGNALDNWIGGNESANNIHGGGGGDTMEGGAGDDYYHVENSGDWVIERPGEGRDLVHAWVSFTLGDNIENLALGAGAGAINGIGNALDNWIGGNESANNLYGGGGGDTMEGGAGDDYYLIENSADRVIERPGEGRDTVHAWASFRLGAEIEVLALGPGAGAISGWGNALDNWIEGNESANYIYGGGGADGMEGGAGDDYYHVENSGDWVFERPGEGRDMVHAWVSFTLGAEIEVLALGAGAGAINGWGNALDNWIEGNESANNLYGEGGADTMVGGAGDDYYNVENSADWVIERPGEGRDLVHTWANFTLGADIEYLALAAGAGAINGAGNALDNWIGGNESANYIYGGGGADGMEGGAGDDYYHVENSGDWVFERPGEGRDMVHAWVSFTLGAEIEVLALGAGAGAINGWGNALDNWIEGNESANNLYGEGGADTMVGGAGDDYYNVENSADWVIERPGEGRDLVHTWANFTLGADIEYLALAAGAGAINGAGNALDNWIGGNESANYIYGGGGADGMEGGAGDDYYHVENSGDWVFERPGEGRDMVHAWVSFTLGAEIEVLALGAGAGAINGWGNALDNWIEGNESANNLYGEGGADTMVGGAGDDYYNVENSADWVIERPGEGRDLVHTWANFTLGADIEYLALAAGAGAINGAGNALDNWIGGNESANTLYGGGGADGLEGGAGADTMVGGAGNDWLAGGDGTDTAVFSGARLDYAVTFDAATQTYTVADRRAGAPDGSDSVTGVELFQFAGGTVTQWELVA